MNNRLIDKQDPRVADLFRRMGKVDKLLDKLESAVRHTFNGQRYLTDSELSALLKTSRRTLQEYRTAGIIPYYLICGKVLYRESEIQQLLEKAHRQCLCEMKLL